MSAILSADAGADIAALADHLSRDEWEPIDEPEARLLTERIRTATRQVCLLLMEVHERRAWLALGYSSWEHYVQREFNISRSRSYELLDQARVVLELRSAAGMQIVPDVSAYVAVQIKPRLRQLTDTIRERAGDASESEAVAIVAEVVDEYRVQAARLRQIARARRAETDNLGHFCDAIELLSSMPPVSRTVQLVDRAEDAQVEKVSSALRWLTEFVTEWKRQDVGARLPIPPAGPSGPDPAHHPKTRSTQ
jgi:hypothetical protein